MNVTRRRTCWDLSRAEATALFEEVVAGHPRRVAALLDTVATRGGPSDRLDFTRDSLHDLWGWVLETQPLPAAPTSDADMRAGDPPWWYEFYAPLAQRLGPDLARLVSLVAAYLAEIVLRRRAGTTWVLGRDREAADFHMPLLQVPRRSRFSPDVVVLNVASQWADGTLSGRDRLAEIFDTRAGRDSTDTAAASRDRAGTVTGGAGGGSAGAAVGRAARPYSIERGAPGRFETVISFDDKAASDAPGGVERIERLVAALAREPGVERVVHEDRELVLVRAPRLTGERLAELVDRHWDASG